MITEQNVRKIIEALNAIGVELALANDLELYRLRDAADSIGTRKITEIIERHRG